MHIGLCFLSEPNLIIIISHGPAPSFPQIKRHSRHLHLHLYCDQIRDQRITQRFHQQRFLVRAHLAESLAMCNLKDDDILCQLVLDTLQGQVDVIRCTWYLADNYQNDNAVSLCTSSHGYHRWALAFSRQDKVLGVFLLWRNPSMGMKVLVDLNFTLINREHFSENLSFCRKKVKYNVDAKAQGSRKFVDMATLENRFIDRNGEFQLEVTLSNVKSVFEHKFRLNQSIFANASRMAKFETSYFSYGSYDWSLALYPNGRSDSQLGNKYFNVFQSSLLHVSVLQVHPAPSHKMHLEPRRV